MPPLRRRIGCRRVSQWLKSPTTLTTSAFGSPDGKTYAGDALCLRNVSAERFVALVMCTLAVKI